MSQQSVRDPVKLNGKEPGHTEQPLSTTINSGPPQHEPIDESQMTLMEHLLELRTRLIWIVGSLVVGTLVAFALRNQIFEILRKPLADAELIAIGPTDTVFNVFKVSFFVGASIAMPIVVYQLIAFVIPGLYPHEKRALLFTIPAIFLLFLIGVWFAYAVMLPVAITFLQQGLLDGQQIKQQWAIDRYIDFFTRVLFWIGVSFETPVVLSFLARTGLLSGPQLLGFWRHAIVIISIIAAIITPTIDPVNMAIVMGPLIILYFISVGLAYLIYRPRTPRDFSQEPFMKE